MIRSFLVVALGCAIGGAGRYAISLLFKSTQGFPYSTLAVNVIGSALIGLIFALGEKYQFAHGTRLFLSTGIMGGFTTFSAFSMETFRLLHSGNTTTAAIYVVSSLCLGILSAAGIYLLTKWCLA